MSTLDDGASTFLRSRGRPVPADEELPPTDTPMQRGALLAQANRGDKAAREALTRYRERAEAGEQT